MGSHADGLLRALPPQHGFAAAQERLDLQSAEIHGLDLVAALGCVGICSCGTTETDRWGVLMDDHVGVLNQIKRAQHSNLVLFELLQIQHGMV